MLRIVCVLGLSLTMSTAAFADSVPTTSPSKMSDHSMKSESMKGHTMKSGAMKGGAMKGHSTTGDAMKTSHTTGGAMKGDAMKPAPKPTP